MSCIDTVEGKQTEFDFYRQLMASNEATQCCGHKVSISFSRPVMTSFLQFIISSGKHPDYLDRFEPVMIGSSHMSLTMCARHWLQHSDLLHTASHVADRDDWNDLSYYIFKVTCSLNDWDAKELSNYIG